jgi:hypothetical protein
MALRKLAAAAALAALATPSAAFDVREAGASTTIFYISIPLDYSLSRKDQQWTAGLLLQGKRSYQAINIDSSVLNFVSDGGVDGKWVVAGLVALGAAAAISKKDRRTSETLQQQQTQIEEQQGGGGTCTKPPVDPCAR